MDIINTTMNLTHIPTARENIILKFTDVCILYDGYCKFMPFIVVCYLLSDIVLKFYPDGKMKLILKIIFSYMQLVILAICAILIGLQFELV